jgi:hypothetical protein
MKTETNVLLRETLARDLRYWEIRKSTAEVVLPPSSSDDAKAASDLMPSPPRDSEERRARPTDTVSFGSTVTIQRKGRTQTFRIVGVDEADASNGLISFRSPLAQAILGARPGDVIEAGEPLGEITIDVLAKDRQ